MVVMASQVNGGFVLLKRNLWINLCLVLVNNELSVLIYEILLVINLLKNVSYTEIF